ncbi:uncharacterized protein TRUGW13939_10325 [Talaromyces rugulosus]|uniref:Carboxymuconolactone decarboxylase-like domain-containing protein n=1 Tax=Talaromyces rugulosus TaxID=121627 RepID=A0A7H8RA27_TALRU|nr:uncharacterized protein TRUGW13939_10325 [Talaromyces rugulosus]QKX63156.1 hypothetical protein TRUGW13939_10325 [Talaromyces rugulosus]
MRLQYIPDPPSNLSEEDQQVCDRIRARRGPAGLLGIDRTLPHAPKVADGMEFKPVLIVLAKVPFIKQRNPTSKGPLSERQWAVLQYADAMTATVQVPQELFYQLRDVGFSSQEITEITATVATYNFTCRFVLALDVGEGIAGAPAWFKEW